MAQIEVIAGVHQKLERWFESLAGFIYNHPKKVLLLVFVMAAAIISQVPKLVIDVSNEGFFHRNSEIVTNYNRFLDQYGREEVILIAIEPERVFDPDFLLQLQALHEELEAGIPYLDEVNSLINARNTRGEGDELIVEDLFDNWPQNAEQLAAIEQRAMSNPVYRNLLLSEDGRMTTVIVRLVASPQEEVDDFMAGFDAEPLEADTAEVKYLTDDQAGESVDKVMAIIDRYRAGGLSIKISGGTTVTQVIKTGMRRDTGRFTIAALVMVALVLGLMFRRLSGVLMPMTGVILTVLCTIGLMAYTGTAFKIITQILPSFLMAVGVGAAVHILALFYREYDTTGDKQGAIVHALGMAGLPVLMACVTTAAGMMSFSNAATAPIAELGLFAGIGVLLSLVFTLVMIPAFLALFPVRQKPIRESSEGGLHELLTAIGRFATGWPRMIVLVCTLATLFAAVGLLSLRFYHNPLAWLPEEEPVRQDTYYIDERIKGVASLEVIFDTGVENGVYEPAFLNYLDTLEEPLKAISHKGVDSDKTLSIVDVVKEINQALNEDREAFHRIPQQRELIAQELFLFENSSTDDLEDFVDSQFSQSRFSVKLPWTDASASVGYLQQVKEVIEREKPANLSYYYTGVMPMFVTTFAETKTSMQESYLIAAVVISLLMILFIGNWRLGLLAMIPNFTPIFMALGLMGFFGIELNVFTMFTGSIAIGLAVDDTMHFLHTYNRFYQKLGDTRQAILQTFQSTGRAMLVTTVVLSLAFFIYLSATMSSVFTFGLITGSTILFALFGDFILMPAILMLLARRRDEGNNSGVANSGQPAPSA